MIARNAVLNIVGYAAPLLAALFLVPALVVRLDTERFGFLALAWVLITYFSLVDLGLGRALSRLVAEQMGTAGEARLPALSRTALGLTLALGVVAAGALWLSADWLCGRLLRLPAALQPEGADALRVVALSVPLVTLTAVLRGLLEAGQRFDWLNAIRVPLGVLMFAAPFIASLWSTNLVLLATALASIRVAAFIAHWLVCARIFPALTRLGWPQKSALREMFAFGAWLTVSNIVGPLLVYLDRFAVGALITVSAVAYYAAPYEVVTRLSIIPAALAGVLFPPMAAASAERLVVLYRTGIKAIIIGVFPLALVAVLFAPDWMRLWLGAEYAVQGSTVAQILGLGVMVNCLAYAPAAVLQARGRTDLAAKMHLVELAAYVVVLVVLIPNWGLLGAALAWTLRCAADSLTLFVLVRVRVLKRSAEFTSAQLGAMALFLLALIGALVPSSLEQRMLYLAAAFAIFAVVGWIVLLEPSERARARNPRSLLLGPPR